jgi:hypothetical protein
MSSTSSKHCIRIAKIKKSPVRMNKIWARKTMILKPRLSKKAYTHKMSSRISAYSIPQKSMLKLASWSKSFLTPKLMKLLTSQNKSIRSSKTITKKNMEFLTDRFFRPLTLSFRNLTWVHKPKNRNKIFSIKPTQTNSWSYSKMRLLKNNRLQRKLEETIKWV